MLTWYVRNSASRNNGANMYLLLLNFSDEKIIVLLFYLKSATTRLYDTEAKIICIVSKKGAQCIECHHKDI